MVGQSILPSWITFVSPKRTRKFRGSWHNSFSSFRFPSLFAFSVFSHRRRNVRIVTSSQLKRRRTIARQMFNHWIVNILILGIGWWVERYFTNKFFETVSLYHFLSTVPPVDVGDLPVYVNGILDYIRQRKLSGANPRAAAESERIKKCLSMVVHLRGRICALNADCLVVAPASGIHCLKYTWSVTQTYFEKQEVTKRRKIKCSTSSSSSSSASASSCESDDCSESEYEEWEEDEIVSRSKVLKLGEDTSPSPFRLMATSAMYEGFHEAVYHRGIYFPLEIDKITRWGGKETVHFVETDAEHDIASIVTAPFVREIDASYKHEESIVRDGSIFEGLGLLQVRLRETNDTTLRILDAKFMPVPPTLAYNAENDVNVIGHIQTLAGISAKIRNEKSLNKFQTGDLEPGENIPFLAETSNINNKFETTCDTPGQKRNRYLRYVWFFFAVFGIITRGWKTHALVKKITSHFISLNNIRYSSKNLVLPVTTALCTAISSSLLHRVGAFLVQTPQLTYQVFKSKQLPRSNVA